MAKCNPLIPLPFKLLKAAHLAIMATIFTALLSGAELKICLMDAATEDTEID